MALYRKTSVCLSPAGVLSKRLNKSSNFSPFEYSHTILVFFRILLMYGNTSTGTTPPAPHLTGTSNAGRYEKDRGFRPISRFISERIQDRAIVTMESEYKPYPSFRMVLFSMTLSDHKWLSKIFNETKHRAVSLRQVSFLSCFNCFRTAERVMSRANNA